MLIDTYPKYTLFARQLAEQSAIAIDTETSGLRVWHGDRIAGVAIGFDDGRTFYIPVRHREWVPVVEYEKEGRRKLRVETADIEWHTFDQLSPTIIRHIFGIIRKHGIELRAHNAKFDLEMFEADGIDTDGLVVYDTMIMARLANNLELSVGLKPLAAKYLDKDSRAEETQLKATLKERGWLYTDKETKESIAHYDWLTPDEIAPYAETDVALTNGLYRLLHPTLIKQGQVEVLAREMKLLHVLVAMEKRGIQVDRLYCKDALEMIYPRIAALESDIYAYVGQEFNINSTRDVGTMLKRLGIRSFVLTKTGNESWNKKALAASDHPIVKLILEYRELVKIVNTYLLNYLEFADENDMIHTDVQQLEAKTGRTSCRSPNLQNVTREDKAGFSLRRCFVPRPGHTFILVDWSQMEVRIMADWARETALMDAIASGLDVHAETALKIAALRGVDACGDVECPSFKRMRYEAKTTFFGLLYGMGVPRLAATLEIEENSAYELRTAFWKLYPNIARFAMETRNAAGRNGFVRNRYGRLYHYFPIKLEDGSIEYAQAYAAVDHRIQGTGADMAKEAMIRVYKGLKEGRLRSHLVMMVHDELIVEAPLDEVDRVIAGVVRVMRDYPKFTVPIDVEVSLAPNNWAEKQHYELKECA